jgi:hypothetical protein
MKDTKSANERMGMGHTILGTELEMELRKERIGKAKKMGKLDNPMREGYFEWPKYGQN